MLKKWHMKVSLLLISALLLVTVHSTGWAQGRLFSPGELDELLAPIALYPDPLLAQILPAATYPNQLIQSAQFAGDFSLIDSQPWDISVKAIAHYPSIMNMMVNNPDWMVAVGQAYVNQPVDVMNSIQRLRERAMANGYLVSNSYDQVYTQDGYIRIVPAQAQYVYVPYYNPQVVYVEPRPSYGAAAITFGVGLLIGSWLNNDVDWHHHDIYYHGWHGSGWVGHARPHVDVNNRHYVNTRYQNRPVPVNRNVTSRDISSYRRDLSRNVGTYRMPARVRPTPSPVMTRPQTRPTSPPIGAGPSKPGTRPTTRPGTRPTVPSARPSTRPTTRPGATPSTRPSTALGRRPGVTPSGPGAGPRVQPTRPVPRTHAPAVAPGSRPSTRPGAVTTPRAPMPRSTSRPEARPSSRPTTRPSARPSVPGTTGRGPVVRSAPRPVGPPQGRPSGGASRHGAGPGKPSGGQGGHGSHPSGPPSSGGGKGHGH